MRPAPPENAPHPEEVRLLEELAAWTNDTPSADATKTSASGTLAEAISEHLESSDFFCLTPNRDVSEQLLALYPFADDILQAADENRLDALLVAAMVETESSFDASARSPKGAQGLLQVMPTTAAELGIADPEDPRENLEAGARYMRRMLERFKGDLTLALAAYNAGPAVVARYGGIPPYPETSAYVERVLRRYLDHRQAVWQSVGEPLEGKLAAR